MPGRAGSVLAGMQHEAALPRGRRDPSRSAPPPFVVELVAGDPPVIGPVVILAWRVPPTAVISAVVALVVEVGALLPDPVAVAVIPRVVVAPVPLAFLPGGELVAGHPEVIGPVIIHLGGVPPTAVIGAVVGLVVHAGAFFPDPVTPAVVAELVSGAGSHSGGSKESSKLEFHRFFVFIITIFRELIKGSI